MTKVISRAEENEALLYAGLHKIGLTWHQVAARQGVSTAHVLNTVNANMELVRPVLSTTVRSVGIETVMVERSRDPCPPRLITPSVRREPWSYPSDEILKQARLGREEIKRADRAAKA